MIFSIKHKVLTYYTNHPEKNLVDKHKTITFDAVGEVKRPCRVYPYQLNRTQVKKTELLRLKSQPMFSDASQTGWRETFDFYNRNFRFSHGKYPAGTFSPEKLMFRCSRTFSAGKTKKICFISNRSFRTLLANDKYPPTVFKATHREKKKRTVPFGPLPWDPVTARSRHGEHLN